MQGVPSPPLSPEEIELLQIELVEHMDAAGNMPLDGAHGILTATAAEEQLDPLLNHVLGALAQDAGLRGPLERFRAQLRSASTAGATARELPWAGETHNPALV